MSEVCTGSKFYTDPPINNREDDERMILNTGAKFIGRSVYTWGGEIKLNNSDFFNETKGIIDRMHLQDTDIIFQAAIFEIVTPEVNHIPIPAWVFEAFDIPVEKRNFDNTKIVYKSGHLSNLWGNGGVPDVTRQEAKLWLYFIARKYIDTGVESIHWGQVMLMGKNDSDFLDHIHWATVIEKVRAYAKTHARRGWILCDGHISPGSMGGPLTHNDTLIFDYNSFPLRGREIVDSPQEVELLLNHLDAIYGKSIGGVTPSGWECEYQPYIVEFDNFGISDNPGVADPNSHGLWGYDEITWYSLQPEEYRNEFLEYAYRWVSNNDAAGYLQMPGNRVITPIKDARMKYRANTKTEKLTTGFNQENKIKEIWNNYSHVVIDSAKYCSVSSLLDDCNSAKGWDGEASISVENNDAPEGGVCLSSSGAHTVRFQKNFSPSFNTQIDEENGSIVFWLYVSDVSLLGSNGQIEITSSNEPDVNEFSWNTGDLGLVDGWNHLKLSLSTANVVNGKANINAVNFFRLYNEVKGDVVIKIDHLIFMSCGSSLPDEEIEIKEQNVSSIQVPENGSIIIDGAIDETEWGIWDGVEDDIEQTNTFFVNHGNTDTLEPFTVRWKTQWDAENLYFAIVVTDDTLIVSDGDSSKKYDVDRIDIAISTDISLKGVDQALNDENFDWWDPNDEKPDGFGIPDDKIYGAQFLFNESNSYETGGSITASEFKFTSYNEVSNGLPGYIIEVKIPWTSLNIEAPAAADQFLFEIEVFDVDEAPGWGNALVWGTMPEHQETFVQLPSPGKLVLQPLFKTANIIPTSSPITIDGTITGEEWGEWDDQPDGVVQKNEIKIHHQGGDADENTVLWKTFADSENLYIGVKVADKNLAIYGKNNNTKFTSDRIDVAIGTNLSMRALDGSAPGYSIMGDNLYGAMVYFSESKSKGGLEFIGPGIEFKFKSHADVFSGMEGYNFEIKIPWSAINYTPVINDELIFELHVYDCDNQPEDNWGTVYAWGGMNAWLEIYNELKVPGVLKIIDLPTSATKGVKKLVNVRIWPNPTIGVLNISSDNFVKTVRIYSITGNQIHYININNSREFTIDIGHLNSGLFFIQMDTEKGAVTKKIVKE